ncbi:MAG: hypothetical protein ACW99U_12005 [Candidatus Thorarchaeota archaeon]|jgi:hypothetical protein
MLVVEDTEASELKRFVVIDASASLGLVQVGSSIRTFDPPRILSYYGMLESRLHDLSTRYSTAFKFLPRKAYEYLKRPPVIGSLYQNVLDSSNNSWLADFFIVHPLVSVGSTILPRTQQDNNTELVHRWCTTPPYGPRLYYSQDMRLGRTTRNGWTCVLNANELGDVFQGPNSESLAMYLRSKFPIFVNLNGPDDLDFLLKWTISLKQMGYETPDIIVSAGWHKEWGEGITRLLDLPNIRMTTAGATVYSLAAIINHLRKDGHGADWSSRLVFSSGYPETQAGDSIPELLSLLMSRSISAKAEDIQRILGGNILALMPPRPPFLHYVENCMSLVAEGRLGKTSMNELSRILEIMATQHLHGVVSIDNMISEDGGNVDLNSYVLTMKDPSSISAMSLALLVERDDTLRLAGWRASFTENLHNRSLGIHNTLVRVSTKSEGPILTSPAHLSRFHHELLKGLQVGHMNEIVSSLTFGVAFRDAEPGLFLLCEEDMRAIGAAPGDIVVALEPGTSNWGVGQVQEASWCPQKKIVISREDADLIGLRNPTTVDLVRFTGRPEAIDNVVFAFESPVSSDAGETSAYLRMNEEEILKKLDGRLLGKGAKVWIGEDRDRISMTLVKSRPQLDPGQIAKLSVDGMSLWPKESFREFNIILAIVHNAEMRQRDIPLETPLYLKRILSPLAKRVKGIDQFLGSLGDLITRQELATIMSLLAIQNLSVNRSSGRLALVSIGDKASKFTIQKGMDIQTSLEFEDDMQSDDVLQSLVFFIMDTADETSTGGQMSEALRTIAELVEDFGQEKPTLAIAITSELVEDEDKLLPFLRAIGGTDNTRLDVIGIESGADMPQIVGNLDLANSRVVPIEIFSASLFESYLLSSIREMTS